MVMAYVGVGTNIERVKHSRAAIDEMSNLGDHIRVSAVYESAPMGFNSGSFYNFVIELNTTQTLTEFSHALRNIEFKWGRSSNAQKYQDRSLDLDILLFGNEISARSPVVPREDIFKYPFVIQPLYDLVPDLVIPNDGRSVKKIWQKMDNFESLSIVDFVY